MMKHFHNYIEALNDFTSKYHKDPAAIIAHSIVLKDPQVADALNYLPGIQILEDDLINFDGSCPDLIIFLTSEQHEKAEEHWIDAIL